MTKERLLSKPTANSLFRLHRHDIGRRRRSVRLLERIGYLQYIGAGGQVELVQGVYTTHSQPECVAIAGERSAEAFGGAGGEGDDGGPAAVSGGRDTFVAPTARVA